MPRDDESAAKSLHISRVAPGLPKPRALVRFRPGASLHRLPKVRGFQEFFPSRRPAPTHASIETTYDLYGKLMPGSEAESAALVDAYLARADTASRLAQIKPKRS